MDVNIPNKQLFRVDEVAKLFSIHPGTVRRWIKEGTMSAIRLPSGLPRITRGVIIRLLTGTTRD